MQSFINKTKLMTGDRALSNLPHELRMKNVSKPMVISEKIDAYKPFYKMLVKAFDNDTIKMNTIMVVEEKIANTDVINKAIEQYWENECDSIVVVGREAVLSIAKLTKLAIEQGQKDIKNVDVVRQSRINVPLIVVPVFYGSGMEAMSYARCYSGNVSYDYVSNALMPDIVIADNSMVMRPSKQILASSVMYALANAIIAYTDRHSNVMTRVTAMSAINIICTSINELDVRKRKAEFDGNLLTSTIIAGMAASQLKVDDLAMMSLVVSGAIKVPYSKVYSMLFMPYYAEMLDADNEYQMDVLLPIIGESRYALTPIGKRAEEVVDNINELLTFLKSYSGFRTTLSSFGMERDMLPHIADKIAKKGIDKELVMRVLERAF